MPRITIFVNREVVDKEEAKAVVDKIKQLADSEIKKSGTTIQATYQEEI